MRLLLWILRYLSGPTKPPRRTAPTRPYERPVPREIRVEPRQPQVSQAPAKIIRGKCWVIDGDTIIIQDVRIRLAGIDAPELNHPYGKQSKWALAQLCKGQTITAHIKPELSYDRVVAQCFLPDGRDLAAELVKIGLAVDWPKFSGGKYGCFEPPGARRKLWRADLRQRGVVMPD
jgi:micrococcal nuclease